MRNNLLQEGCTPSGRLKAFNVLRKPERYKSEGQTAQSLSKLLVPLKDAAQPPIPWPRSAHFNCDLCVFFNIHVPTLHKFSPRQATRLNSSASIKTTLYCWSSTTRLDYSNLCATSAQTNTGTTSWPMPPLEKSSTSLPSSLQVLKLVCLVQFFFSHTS